MKILLSVLVFCLLCLANPAMAAANGATVKVRGGIHERYNRMVFDWHQKVAFKIDQQNNTVTIQFLKPGMADFRSLMAVKPPLIHDITQQQNAQGLLVAFHIPDKARIESFRTDEGSIAFDVLHMDTAPPKFSEPIAATNPPELKPPEATPAATDSTEAKLKNDAHLQTLADRLADKPPENELQNKSASTAPVPSASVTADKIKGTVIRLDPGVLTRLAVFLRAGKLWVVLDKAAEQLTPVIEGDNTDALTKNARRFSLPGASAFLFDAPAVDTAYAIRRVNNQWQIWLNGDKPFLPDNVTIAIATVPPATSPTASFYAGENAVIVPLKDKQVEDRLWVVPMRTPEGRMISLQNTPDYQILPSLMGAVIVPLTDAVKAEAQGDKIILTANDGQKLSLSNDDDRKRGNQLSAFVPLFDLSIDKLPDAAFSIQRQEVETRLVAQKNSQDKVNILLDLARLNIAHGFGEEAQGALRIAQKLTPDIETTRPFQALRGMATALSGDLETAKTNLSGDGIQSQPMAKLWLGYSFADHHLWEQARNNFADAGNAANAMPPALRPRLILARAETALQSGDIAETDRLIQGFDRQLTLIPSEQAEFDYIDATSKIKDKDGNSGDMLKKLIDGHDRLYQVKAQMALTRQELADKKIDLPEAIKRYERLRFNWRNDRLEIDILKQLGQFYIDNKQYMEGLDIWRQAASLSKISEDTDAITSSMQKVFFNLYVDGAADKLGALQAVALFDRFRELTPSGDAGNTALSHLADRLAAVDLLDQADSLLEKQLMQNAKGEDTAKIGVKLASWRLQDRNPGGALKALDESASDSRLPDSLSQKRLLLRARALADLNKTDEALTLLSTLQSPESYSLKIDISWRQNRWGDAVEALQPLITQYRDAGKTDPNGPMPPLILKMAIAMTLDDNKKGMELLFAQYNDFMAKTAQAQAFNLIANPAGTGSLADMETLKKQVGDVELFQKFLKDFGK